MFVDVLQNSYSLKFCKTYKKASAQAFPFYKVIGLYLYSRKDSDTGVFWWNLQDTLDTLFTEHLQATVSVLRKKNYP